MRTDGDDGGGGGGDGDEAVVCRCVVVLRVGDLESLGNAASNSRSCSQATAAVMVLKVTNRTIT